MVEKEIIVKNLKEYMEIAGYAFSKRKFNTSVTLYYKAMVELCDLELFNKLNRIGVNHTERFKLLEDISPVLYHKASKLFRFYRDSYNKEISETIAKLVKEEVENAERDIIREEKD